MPRLRVRLPDITFTEHLTLYGSVRRAELLSYGGGHTGSDAMLYLPEEGILFMADLLFVESHPYLADGDPQATLRILDRVASLAPKITVPGHGPVGTVAHLGPMKQHMIQLQTIAAELVRNGGGAEEAETQVLPDAFSDWQLDQFFVLNLRYLMERNRAQVGESG